MARICGKEYKVFFKSGEKNHTRKNIKKLCQSGVITTNYEKLLDSSSIYYKTLYSSKDSTVQPDILGHFLGEARITKLSEEDRLSCEGLITIEECVKALDTFEKGKTPDFFLPLVVKGNKFVYLTKENIHHYKNGHHGNETYLRQGILLFKVRDRPYFKDT